MNAANELATPRSAASRTASVARTTAPDNATASSPPGIRSRGRGLWLLAAALLVALAAALPAAPAQAQTVTLVSNTGQSQQSSALRVIANGRRGQAFTTGPGSGAFRLTSVDIVSADAAGDSFTASVCTTDNNGRPTNSCTDLTSPGDFAAGTLTFTVPAGTTLTLVANTTYAVRFSAGAAPVDLAYTTSASQDPGGTAGWSISNSSMFYQSSLSPPWGEEAGWVHQIAIRGEILAAPTVANAIPDQEATAGAAFEYVVPANTFSDANPGDTLTYSAARADDTALPSWLTFTPATRTLLGHARGGGRRYAGGEGDRERRHAVGQRHLQHQGGGDRRLPPHDPGARRHRRRGRRRHRLRRRDGRPARGHHREP